MASSLDRPTQSLLLYLLPLVFILSGCSHSISNVTAIKKLAGNWTTWSGQGKTYFIETWTKTSTNEFTGEGLVLDSTGRDTLFREALKLSKKDNQIYYTANVAHNSGPVEFRLTKKTDHKLVFENPEHDFPSKIVYEFLSENHLIAVVSGERDGSETGDTLEMWRQ